ncbi:hypothetical protein EBU99_09170 [bacterium]|nr:hypothetical protein [bacterium]
MILNLMAFLSCTLFAPVRLSCALLGRIISSEKAKIFLLERREKAWIEAIAKAAEKLNSLKTSEHFPVVYWLHVASAGELEQVIPILRRLSENHGVYFFLTYFSPSAKPFTKNCPGMLNATSLPLEDMSAFTKAIQQLKIKRLLLVRYDFWPALIKSATRAGIPIAVLSATLSRARSVLPTSVQFALRRHWFTFADRIFLVSESDKDILIERGISKDKIVVCGDAKWTRARERAEKNRLQSLSGHLGELQKLLFSQTGAEKRKVIVFGSPHEEELSVLEQCLQAFLSREIVIVAPSEVDSKTVNAIEERLMSAGATVHRISRFTDAELPHAITVTHTRCVILLDRFGSLADAYHLADIAIVGGGFDGQLHNVLEPSAHPIVTLYGNQTHRAQEATLLLAENAALGFAKPENLFQFLNRWGTLDSVVEERSEMTQTIGRIQENARRLFGSLPDTSEVVCRSLAQQDGLEAP